MICWSTEYFLHTRTSFLFFHLNDRQIQFGLVYSYPFNFQCICAPVSVFRLFIQMIQFHIRKMVYLISNLMYAHIVCTMHIKWNCCFSRRNIEIANSISNTFKYNFLTKFCKNLHMCVLVFFFCLHMVSNVIHFYYNNRNLDEIMISTQLHFHIQYRMHQNQPLKFSVSWGVKVL